jgi:hypothetical protein
VSGCSKEVSSVCCREAIGHRLLFHTNSGLQLCLNVNKGCWCFLEVATGQFRVAPPALFLCGPKVQYRVHRCPSLNSVMSLLNPAHKSLSFHDCFNVHSSRIPSVLVETALSKIKCYEFSDSSSIPEKGWIFLSAVKVFCPDQYQGRPSLESSGFFLPWKGEEQQIRELYEWYSTCGARRHVRGT